MQKNNDESRDWRNQIWGFKEMFCIALLKMEKEELTRLQWLIHAQEEAMDFCIYLQKLIEMEG